jgi:uncharacterized protein (UPF0276 family)
VPARAGIGLRAPHHREFLERRPALPWVEVHSENFFADGGRQLEVLEAVRRDYAVSLHGVGLSLGSTDPLDEDHLRRLKRLVARIDPALVSEHVSWSSVNGEFLNDLLPLPLTEEALAHVARRVERVQEQLGRQILVENVSSYLRPGEPEMTEWEFVAGLAARAGCRVLLDVNNVYVNARNHGFEPLTWLEGIPRAQVAEIHLAGHSVVADGPGELLVDTHDAPVAREVWSLYEAALRRFGAVPTLIEWDARLPPLDDLLAEAHRADARLEGRRARVA